MPPVLGVLAQDQAGPVERAREDPRRLRARPLGRLDLDRAPLLPDHRAGQGGDQGDDDHRGEQGRAALAARAPADARRCRAAIGVMARCRVSRTRLPLRPLPGAKASTRRTPLGSAWRCGAAPCRAGRRAAGDVAGRLAVRPGVALEEVDLPLLEAGQRLQLAGLAALELLACAASSPAARCVVVTGGPAQRCHIALRRVGAQRPGDDLHARPRRGG